MKKIKLLNHIHMSIKNKRHVATTMLNLVFLRGFLFFIKYILAISSFALRF